MGVYQGNETLLELPPRQTVGIHVNFSHIAGYSSGLSITVRGRLDKIEGRKSRSASKAHDGIRKKFRRDTRQVYHFHRKVQQKSR